MRLCRFNDLTIFTGAVLLWMAAPSAAAGDPPTSSTAPALSVTRSVPTPDRELLPRGTWAFQLDSTFIHPFSGERFEQFIGGQAGVSYYLCDRVAANLDIPVYWVNQRGPNTFAGGFDLLARWHFFEHGPLTLYADGGAGMLFSNREVPRGGTHVNFTPQAGLGATWQINDGMYLFGGARYWHLSNAGMCGHQRNPSIDGSVMAYFGVGWKS